MTHLVGCALFPHPPIMMTEVGGAECLHVHKTIASAEAAAQFLQEKNPTTIVVMTPHGPAFRDAVGVNVSPVLKGNLAAFGAAEVAVSFETNSLLVSNIIKQSNRLGVSLLPLDNELAQQHRFSLQLDHGAVIPLRYLYRAGFRGQVVHMSTGFLTYPEMYACGKAVQAAVEATRQKVAIIASGDLSHRLKPGAPAGFDPAGQQFDVRIVELLQSMDVRSMFDLSEELVEAAGECGLRPIFFLMGALDGLEVASEVLSYEGPFGVGYAVATFAVKKPRPKEGAVVKQESIPVRIAKASLHYLMAHGKILPAFSEPLPPELQKPAGVFVSLKKQGQLRGCIGSILPTQVDAASEIISNAVSAATADPRFPRVQPDELAELKISVDILTTPARIASPAELDPRRYGVIVRQGSRSGVLLPDLEGVDTVEDQVNIACQKAGIVHSEQLELYRFEVVRYY